MLTKILTLRSLPYIVGIASSIVAANEIVRSTRETLDFRSAINMESASTYGQTVNRLTKTDKLEIRNAAPLTSDKTQTKIRTQITPRPRIDSTCEPPIDLMGRCFARAETDFYVAQID
jgi:hypothetical protein